MRTSNEMKGAFATVFTPFKEGNHVDFDELKRDLEFVCESDITGLFPLASCGEFHFLQLEEKKEFLKVTAEVNNGRKAMIAGCCGVNYSETMDLIKTAAQYKYDAAIICPPYYFSPTEDSLIRYYEAVAANEYKMPIIIYNIPAFTTEVPLSVIDKLMDNKMVVGCKDSSGNARRIRTMAQFRKNHGRDDFNIYCGCDDILAPARVAGADGSCSAMAYLTPEIVARLHKSYNDGDLQDAIKCQDGIAELARLAETVAFPAGYKVIAKLRGMKMGYEHTFCNEEYLAKTTAKIDALLDENEKTLGVKKVIL